MVSENQKGAHIHHKTLFEIIIKKTINISSDDLNTLTKS